MLSALLVSAAVLALSPQADHDHGPKLGKVAFHSSCSVPANVHFERGLTWLHSFEYDRAEKDFLTAAEVDPS